jgi:hypothetical protein
VSIVLCLIHVLEVLAVLVDVFHIFFHPLQSDARKIPWLGYSNWQILFSLSVSYHLMLLTVSWNNLRRKCSLFSFQRRLFRIH